MKKIALILLIFAFTLSAFGQKIALKPPMGWNSFDAYDSRINEDEYRRTVEFMDKNLKRYGWEYAVIDYVWYNDAPGNWDNPNRRYGHPDIRFEKDGKPIDRLEMDQYGRLMPSVKRFPSAAGGKGFKPLADWVHSKGLKFGIHIMRGIPRQAVYENLPIMGTKYRAKDIAETWDTCPWNNNMWGVDPTKPGAQAYYDSLFKLYASWDVDFIKADDILYPNYHEGEIEMLRKAIDKSGRPMILSLSPGEAPLGKADHLAKNANMWRISEDFWDDWESLHHNFDLLNAWSSHSKPGQWADADMIPFGRLALDNRPKYNERDSRYTWDEYYTLMSLWCIARSPLMMGGDLLTSSPKAISFLQNEEVLYVNQNSTNNHQVFKDEDYAVWIADDPKTGDKFVAMFNFKKGIAPVAFDFETEMLRGKYKIRDLWEKKDLGEVEGSYKTRIGPHGAKMFRLTKVK